MSQQKETHRDLFIKRTFDIITLNIFLIFKKDLLVFSEDEEIYIRNILFLPR